MLPSTEVPTAFTSRYLFGPDSPETHVIQEQVPTQVSEGSVAICGESERLWIDKTQLAFIDPDLYSPQKTGSRTLQMHLRHQVLLHSFDYQNQSYKPILNADGEPITVDILIRPTDYNKTIAFIHQGPLTGLLAYISYSELDHNGELITFANRWFNNSADIRTSGSSHYPSGYPNDKDEETIASFDRTMMEFNQLYPNPTPIQALLYWLDKIGLEVDTPNLHYTQSTP